MDFYKLVLLIIIAAAELSTGKKSDNETSMITCKPIKEGQTAYLDAKLFLNSYEYIISKNNDLNKIVCKTNACIIATQGFRVILNTTFNKEDNSTQVIVWFKNSFDIEGNWTLMTYFNNDKRQLSFRYEYCKVFESIKDISCENITDFEGLKINCRSSNVSYAFKCFFELQINENYQQIDESDCSLRISKKQLTVGTYNVTVTYYPENYPEMKFKLGTSKEFIFEKYGPKIELDGCLTTIEEQKQILCRCTNKTEVQTMFWSSTDGNSLNSNLLNITAQKGRYTYFCSATDQYGIFKSSIVYEFNVTAYFCKATDQYGTFNSSIVYEFNVTATAHSDSYMDTFWFGLCVGYASETCIIVAFIAIFCMRRRVLSRARRRTVQQHNYDQLDLQSNANRETEMSANYQEFESNTGHYKNTSHGSVYDVLDA